MSNQQNAEELEQEQEQEQQIQISEYSSRLLNEVDVLWTLVSEKFAILCESLKDDCNSVAEIREILGNKDIIQVDGDDHRSHFVRMRKSSTGID